tara:strand:- start:500 stop:862 length:363 start_codon:yes stop_codon:yes gene_type:complete
MTNTTTTNTTPAACACDYDLAEGCAADRARGGLCETIHGFSVLAIHTPAAELLAAAVETAAALEAYCDDHASERPTDPTVTLPRLLAAIAAAAGGDAPPTPEPTSTPSHPASVVEEEITR